MPEPLQCSRHALFHARLGRDIHLEERGLASLVADPGREALARLLSQVPDGDRSPGPREGEGCGPAYPARAARDYSYPTV